MDLYLPVVQYANFMFDDSTDDTLLKRVFCGKDGLKYE
jgi:hypothetical protein